ncbi:glycine zipper 2TM domain-containing protein [Gammaproteobacteria bacterium]|nr:glycine zipper 2TM domain-containing protein [Gammaproteobacteria bacterium]MDA9048473.1 glycine zipper 2TM domain-containing protein [Gammaproteobacteria bacterium]MDA9154249.1 glycine zipper 2TM domain-containing protein [Gammaproteobacteria bacterium]
MLNQSKYFATLITAVLLISGCSYNSLKPEVVDRSAAQRMQTVVFATVVSIDRVILSGDGDTGAFAGAILGAVAGSSVTDSETESDVAGVLGALVGSAIGAKAGDAATRKPAIELLLDLDSGKTVSIIQEEGDYSFEVGQRVKIIKNKGKSRVMPLK